jgi:hypothetical protein
MTSDSHSVRLIFNMQYLLSMIHSPAPGTEGHNHSILFPIIYLIYPRSMEIERIGVRQYLSSNMLIGLNRLCDHYM